MTLVARSRSRTSNVSTPLDLSSESAGQAELFFSLLFTFDIWIYGRLLFSLGFAVTRRASIRHHFLQHLIVDCFRVIFPNSFSQDLPGARDLLSSCRAICTHLPILCRSPFAHVLSPPRPLFVVWETLSLYALLALNLSLLRLSAFHLCLFLSRPGLQHHHFPFSCSFYGLFLCRPSTYLSPSLPRPCTLRVALLTPNFSPWPSLSLFLSGPVSPFISLCQVQRSLNSLVDLDSSLRPFFVFFFIYSAVHDRHSLTIFSFSGCAITFLLSSHPT